MATVQKGDATYQKLKEFFDARSVPEYVWWSIIKAESGGNMAAVGDNGSSFGLFQIHEGKAGFTAAEKHKLQSDALYNAQRAYSLWMNRGQNPADYAASKAKEGTGEYVAYYWIYAQRPQAWTMYNQNGTFNAPMQTVAGIAGTNGASPATSGGDGGTANPETTQQILDNSTLFDILAALLGIAGILIIVVQITKEHTGGLKNVIPFA